MMGRTWLVAVLAVAGLFSVAAPAHAKRAPECECPMTQTYPLPDAVQVPTNQRSIEIAPWDENEQFKITSLGELEPNSDYNHDSPYLRFHTGKGPDLQAPATPTNVIPSIVLDPVVHTGTRITNAEIAMHGVYDEETQFLEVEVENTTGGGKAHFGVPTWNAFMCGYPLRTLKPGPAHIKVWAIDHAGNRSAEPWTGDMEVAASVDALSGDVCEHHHVRCGMGSAFLFLLVVPAGFILLLIVLAISAAIRRSRIKYTVGEHVSIPLGESVARIVAKAYVIKFFVSLATIAALWQFEHEILAILLSPLPLLWLFDVLRSAAVVRRFAHPVNRLERKDDFLLVDHTLLYCGRRAWNRASRLPTATLPKR